MRPTWDEYVAVAAIGVFSYITAVIMYALI